MSEVALRKVGTSFVATIPAELVQQLKLVEGQKLAVGKENGRIVFTPVTAEMDAKRYRSALQKLADV
jgi:antitoxin component of MazEF toxin-antitoxin module